AGKISAANMAVQLEPLLGGMAHYFFAIGLCAAGLTSAITAPLAGAYAVCGMLGWSTKMSNTRFKGVAIIILAFGAVVASLGLDPVAVIIFAQAANGLLLPIVTCYLVWLVNQKSIIGEYTNSVFVNVVVFPVLLLIFSLSIYKLFSLIF
ncbi:MAG: divalent metal cation transporter, partial [Thiomicrorhabdus sp.]|nr:divalent metal cation transporter [Thiomicrorhabdus sp.]